MELGALVWWSVGTSGISHAQFVATSGRHGLNSKYVPTEVKPTTAFLRAWRHARTKLAERLMLRPIAETPAEIVVGLVRERSDEERRELDYDLVTRIVFDKGTST